MDCIDRVQNGVRNETIHLLLREHKLIWSLWQPMCKANVLADRYHGLYSSNVWAYYGSTFLQPQHLAEDLKFEDSLGHTTKSCL